MAGSSPIGRRVLVSGRVQGVGFRYLARDAAIERRVRGWVRNLFDGRVEIRVEGGSEEVRSMLRWLESGPPSARVDEVLVESREPEGATEFEIKATAHS